MDPFKLDLPAKEGWERAEGYADNYLVNVLRRKATPESHVLLTRVVKVEPTWKSEEVGPKMIAAEPDAASFHVIRELKLPGKDGTITPGARRASDPNRRFGSKPAGASTKPTPPPTRSEPTVSPTAL